MKYNNCSSLQLIYKILLFYYYYDIVIRTLLIDQPTVQSLVYASPPLNDLCINSIPYEIGTTIFISTSDATVDTDICVGTISPGVWYNFNSTKGGRFYMKTSTVETVGDTTVYVVIPIAILANGCDTSITSIKCLYVNTYSEDSYVDIIPNITYHMLVSSNLLYIDLTIALKSSNANNSNCITAEPMAVGSTVYFDPYQSVLENEFSLSTIVNCIPEPDFVTYDGAWFSFAGTGERVVARSCNFFYTPVKIVILTGACNGTLTCIAATTTTPTCGGERFIFETIKGAQYHVLLLLYRPYRYERDSFYISTSAVPSNNSDICMNAAPYTLGSTMYVDTSYATLDPINYGSICQKSFASPESIAGVWYAFVGDGDRHAIQTCQNKFAYTFIAVFSGECSTLECIVSDYTNCVKNRVPFDALEGKQYYVLVSSGSYLQTDFTILSIPLISNDFCTDAKPYRLGFELDVDTTNATIDVVSNGCSGSITGPGVWFTFTGSGRLFIARYFNTVYDVSIAIYTSTCDSLQCVAVTRSDPCQYYDRCFDVGLFGRTLLFDTVRGTTYHVHVVTKLEGIAKISISQLTFLITPVHIVFKFFRRLFGRLLD
jgi:hypothetical protein